MTSKKLRGRFRPLACCLVVTGGLFGIVMVWGLIAVHV